MGLRIEALPFEFKIKRFTELPSTNTYARQQAELGAEEGLVYVAENQTEGRGQFDRKWISPAGKNLLFSILLRPRIAPSKAPIFTQITCQAITRLLKHYDIEAEIKRPNDILVKGKKICGILTESSSRSPKQVESVIIGIGLNVNETPKKVTPKPTSMKDVLGKELDLHEVLNLLLEELGKDLIPVYAAAV